jgi:hypothetical protein
MVSTVISAVFYLTSALSGMRSSELHELVAGARRREMRAGGLSRDRLVSRRIKGEAFGGVEDAWVVLEDVYRSLGLAEALSGAAAGELRSPSSRTAPSSGTAGCATGSTGRWASGSASQTSQGGQ